MTFVINQQMNEMGDDNDFIYDDYLFDAEQYNYAIRRRSSLTDLNLIANPRKLKYVLQKMYEADPFSIELLQFYYT